MIIETGAIGLDFIGSIPDADRQLLGCTGFVQPQTQKRHCRKLRIDRIDLDRRSNLMDTLLGRPCEKLHAVMHCVLLPMLGGTVGAGNAATDSNSVQPGLKTRRREDNIFAAG